MIHTDGKPTIANDPRSRAIGGHLGIINVKRPKQERHLHLETERVISAAEKITREAAK